MPLLQHIYLSPRYLSLQCLAADKTRSRPPWRAVHERLSWTIPAEFWWVPLPPTHPTPPPPLLSQHSGVGGGNIRDGDENVAQRLHSHSGIHAFNKSKEGEEDEVREKGGEGSTCCLKIHSLTLKSECRTKHWWCPCPDRGEGELSVSVMKSFLFALHYEQVVVGIRLCGSAHPCGSDCFVVNLSISPQRRWLLQIPFGKYDAGAIRQGQGH